MKKIFCVFFLFASIGCGSKETPVAFQETDESKELTFPQEGGRQAVQLENDVSNALLILDESGKDWCEAELKDNRLNITVKYNTSLKERETSITIDANNKNKSVIAISQKGIGMAIDDDKLTVDIPLGGNSYVTTSGGSGGGSVGDAGFTSWTSENTVFSTFFRVNKAGDLKMFLRYRTSDDGNIIAVTCQGSIFDVELPKPTTRTDTVVFLCAIEKVDPGYIKVDFKGDKLNGKIFASPYSLLVGGTSTESMNFVGDFSYYWGRRGPSVHMSYAIPSEVTAEWFYNEVTVPIGYDPVGSYFMANGFSEGYFGMQVNSETERRILFSVWSPYPTDDPSTIPDEDRVKLIKKGDDVIINDFGNEGSGGQSYLKFDWKAGKTYGFLNRIRPISDGYSEYTAYFYSPEVGEWKLIAQWKRPKIQTFYKGAHSFLENFNNNMGYVARKACYNNQWIYTSSNQWIELTRGRFTVDATGRPGWRMDYKGGVENDGFFLQNCGFFNDYVNPDTQFDRKSTGNRPDINLDDLE